MSTAFSTRNTNIYSHRKINVEPVFVFLKAILGFTRMSLRGVTNAKRKHGLALLAFNIRKITELSANQFNNNRTKC
ncbi:transposase [Staphylococcus gallinarum]|nr:transposase [Staphylococcus gallinarum]